MYGYIYKTTNLINGKIYIGQHKAAEFEYKKYIGSGKEFSRIVKEFGGKRNFNIELLEEIENPLLMDEREIYWISYFDSTNPEIGYNKLKGGQSRFFTGQKHNQKSRHLMSEKALKRSREVNHDIYRTNSGKISIYKNCKNIMIYAEDLPLYEAQGWIKGKYFKKKLKAWNNGKTKETNSSVRKNCENRNKHFIDGPIGCYGRKLEENVNWKTDEFLVENYINKGFAEIWLKRGKCYTCKFFHIAEKIYQRCLKLAGLVETDEHRKQVYRYNRNKNKDTKTNCK